MSVARTVLSYRWATGKDIPELLNLKLAVDADQERRFGDDRWCTTISAQSVARNLKASRVLIGLRHRRIVGAVRMDTRKPWAIDLKYFTSVQRAVYLHDVNVEPRSQRSGVGRRLLEQVIAAARQWPVDAIRLDAYDGRSGAGPFYRKCGFNEVGRGVYRGVPLVYFEHLLN